MSKKVFAWVLMVALASSLVLGACGPAETEAPPEIHVVPPVQPIEPAEAPPPPPSPLVDVDPSGQTVVFWHVWGTGSAGDRMVEIVDEFNATNEWGITVEALDQGSYRDAEDNMNAAIQTGDLPDMVVAYQNAARNWEALGTLADLNPYVADAVWGLTEEEQADFYPAFFNQDLTPEGMRTGFPIMRSAQVLFYNKTWAEELGFADAPITAEEFKEQVCAAAEFNNSDGNPDTDGTGGFVIWPGASENMGWVFAFGGNVIDENETAYDFTTPEVVEAVSFLKGIYDEGCAFRTEGYPNPQFATRQALVTMSSIAGTPYQVSAMEEAGSTDEWWTIAPPGTTAEPAVNLYGPSMSLVKSNPEKELASWLFTKYFTSPEVQAQWIEVARYFPTRASTVDLLTEYAAANPQWGMALALLPYGHTEPRHPSWTTVRRDMQDTMDAILQAGSADEITGLLEELNITAAEVMAELE